MYGPRGQPRPALRFESLRPASPAAAGQWKRAATYCRSLLDDDQAAASPLILSQANWMLAATVLAVFPNNLLTGPTRQDRLDAHPGTLGHAIAFIDEHAHQDITITDIAAAAHVSVRAVQLAFRHQLDTTPLAYLRRVRLSHAHRNLMAADPADETVTAVAYRWGFTSTSQFTALYQQAYGVPPSHTLHQDEPA